MMLLLRNLAVAFSLYSKIPMPQFQWKEEDMKYNLVFLPFVGLVIGGLEYLCFLFLKRFGLPDIFAVVLLSLVPLLITGGFHLDGFMDTQDALRSYKPKEEKLKILEDPHIGAFAVISLVTYCCAWAGALSAVWKKMDEVTAICFGAVFVMSRILTGISSIVLDKAKKDGMLKKETGRSGNGCVIVLFVQLAALLVVLFYVERLVMAVYVAEIFLFYLYYKAKTKKEFGGVTGDTAGYYLSMNELLMVMGLALCVWVR